MLARSNLSAERSTLDPAYNEIGYHERSAKTGGIFTVRNSSRGKVMFSQESVCTQGGGGVHPPRQKADTTPRWADTPPPADGHCSGWYASYWNAFLF